jgi:hypothetical protein
MRRAALSLNAKLGDSSGRRRVLSGAWLLLGLWMVIGCAEQPVAFTEIKRLDETLTDEELKSFFQVVESLPNQKVPPFPAPFSKPPVWGRSRTLPVRDLVQEEKRTLDDGWSINRLAEQWQRNRLLRRALRRAEMTPEQFVGFVQVIGVALAREEIEAGRDLDKVASRGELVVQRLGKDERVFSALSEEGAHYVLQQAAWLPLLDTVQHLRMIPPESRRLVQQHAARLRQMFPEELLRNPLEGFAQLLDASSVPFEELPESGSDDQLTWSSDQVILGTDLPAATPVPAVPEPSGDSEAAAQGGQ